MASRPDPSPRRHRGSASHRDHRVLPPPLGPHPRGSTGLDQVALRRAACPPRTHRSPRRRGPRRRSREARRVDRAMARVQARGVVAPLASALPIVAPSVVSASRTRPPAPLRVEDRRPRLGRVVAVGEDDGGGDGAPACAPRQGVLQRRRRAWAARLQPAQRHPVRVGRGPARALHRRARRTPPYRRIGASGLRRPDRTRPLRRPACPERVPLTRLEGHRPGAWSDRCVRSEDRLTPRSADARRSAGRVAPNGRASSNERPSRPHIDEQPQPHAQGDDAPRRTPTVGSPLADAPPVIRDPTRRELSRPCHRRMARPLAAGRAKALSHGDRTTLRTGERV